MTEEDRAFVDFMLAIPDKERASIMAVIPMDYLRWYWRRSVHEPVADDPVIIKVKEPHG